MRGSRVPNRSMRVYLCLGEDQHGRLVPGQDARKATSSRQEIKPNRNVRAVLYEARNSCLKAECQGKCQDKGMRRMALDRDAEPRRSGCR